MIVRVALRAGATLEHGSPEQFDEAARAAGRQDARQTGWWRQALGMQPREEPPPPPVDRPDTPPRGWQVI